MPITHDWFEMLFTILDIDYNEKKKKPVKKAIKKGTKIKKHLPSYDQSFEYLTNVKHQASKLGNAYLSHQQYIQYVKSNYRLYHHLLVFYLLDIKKISFFLCATLEVCNTYEHYTPNISLLHLKLFLLF